MKKHSLVVGAGLLTACCFLVWADAKPDKIVTGSTAFATVLTEKPGIFRKLTPADLPLPNATPGVANFARVIARPDGVVPQTLPGFRVNLFVSGLNTPRAMQQAPNGDVFVAETGAKQIRV